jgi:hypothetical protein
MPPDCDSGASGSRASLPLAPVRTLSARLRAGDDEDLHHGIDQRAGAARRAAAAATAAAPAAAAGAALGQGRRGEGGEAQSRDAGGDRAT